MNCQECGHGMNKHTPYQGEGCLHVDRIDNVDVVCACLNSPSDIAAHAIEAAREEILQKVGAALVWLRTDTGGQGVYFAEKILMEAQVLRDAPPAEQTQLTKDGVSSKEWFDEKPEIKF